MRNMIVLASLGLAVLVGCDKKVQLTFVNGTQQERTVQLQLPNEGPDVIGTVGGLGGRVNTTVKIPQDELPATLSWQAGDLGGRFTIDKKTPGKLMIPIDPHGVGPIDKKTEVKVHEKSETQDKQTRTVVE